MTVRPSTFTSRVTRADTRSSTLAVSLETAVSIRMPITDAAAIVRSSNAGSGGADGADSVAGAGASGACSASGVGAGGAFGSVAETEDEAGASG